MAEEVKRKRGRPPKKKEPILTEETQELEIEAEDSEQLSSAQKLTPKKQMLKDYYDNVKLLSLEHFHIEPHTDNSYECCVCHKKKAHTEFFRSYSWGHIGSLLETGERHLPICKRCAKKIFIYYYSQEKVLKKAIHHWCQTLDLYFSDDIYDKMIDLHNSRKDTVMADKFDYITDYITALGRAKMVGQTYWDSPHLEDTIVAIDTDNEDIVLDFSSQQEYPEEFEGWDKEDLENYDYIVSIYKYDPFKDEPIEDRKKLYYNLAGFSDESIMDDFSKANAAIDTCRSMQRLEKLNKIRVHLENAETPDIKEIKAVSDLQKIERDAINKNGKEYGFIQKYSMNRNQGSGTFTGIIKQMNEELFEDELANAYDIKTSHAMQMAAEASWKGIFEQLNLSESEFSEIIKTQRETIVNLRSELDKVKEINRQLHVIIKQKDLEDKLALEEGEAK
jgi:hypothetical protein